MMNTQLKISDLIDLEYFLHQEQDPEDNHKLSSPEKRDRNIFLEHIEPSLMHQPKKKPNNRKFIIGKWLEARREIERNNKGKEFFLPGETFNHAYTLFLFLFIIAGFTSGAGTAFSYLVYKGTEPLNVSSYLGIFVLSQIILLLLLGIYMFLYRNVKSLGNFSIVRFIVSSILIKSAFLLKKASFSRLSVEKRTNVEAALGIIKGKSKLYGNIFPWPVFILSQLFGVFFNMGILTATLLRVIGSDLAFGWQSTLQLSSQAIYDAVSYISLPWSWFVSPILAHPSLEQIEGTRMVLKDGITSLATSDLVSWWPFLCFAVLFYAFIPRFILLIIGVTGKNLSINRMSLQSIVFDKLILRLQTPCLDTEGEPQINGRPVFSPNNSDLAPLTSAKDLLQTEDSAAPLIALIPEDIFDICDPVELEEQTQKIFGTSLKNSSPVTFDFSTDKQLLSSLVPDVNTILILQEAWQPPIRETIMYFQDLRHFTGPNMRIHILLTGKSSGDTLFTKTEKTDMAIWKHKINALGDPNIALEQI